MQRVPATETQGRIHTSACTVAVLPEPDEAQAVQINPADLRIDTYRASGAGGQHINKTDSAVRITHMPTGIVAECQDDRSQHRNKAKALQVLAARHQEKERSERAAKEAATRKGLIGSGDRSDRIRTYNFPQGRLTDHRINLTLYKLQAIMEGDLDEVIAALQRGARGRAAGARWRAARRHDHGRPRRWPPRARCGLARLDAQALLGHLLRRPRGWLLAHDDAALTAVEAQAFEALAARRAAGEPLAYLVGEKEFHGLRLAVDRALLVPRPETEMLVDWALECLRKVEGESQRVPQVLDLGTGSGAIALAVKHACPFAAVTAVDASARRARRGPAQRRSAAARDRLAGERLVVRRSPGAASICCSATRPTSPRAIRICRALAHEPVLALTAGRRRAGRAAPSIAGAPQHLSPGGWLLLEHGHDQGEAVRRLLAAGRIQLHRDAPRSRRSPALQRRPTLDRGAPAVARESARFAGSERRKAMHKAHAPA